MRYDSAGNILNSKREMFFEYQKLIDRFSRGKISEIEKINLLSGIRGVGKTTLLAQLFHSARTTVGAGSICLYLDVSRLAAEKISLNDFFGYFAAINNFHWETAEGKIIVFLDEVHYDPDWGLWLKNLFDRTKSYVRVLVIATGSSALKIRLNPDLSRRSRLKEIYPLKFSEFLALKSGLVSPKGMAGSLAGALFSFRPGRWIYRQLLGEQPAIDRFFACLPPDIEEEFLLSGGFPFVLKLKNSRQLAYELIGGVLEKLITKDILELKRFNSQTIAKITDVLSLIAASDATDYAKLGDAVKLDYRSLRSVIEALVYAGILFEAKSYSG